MRIKILLQHLEHQKLPIDYHYLISAWIYRTLSKSDPVFAQWLHDKGFQKNGRNYKLFCFSNLKPSRFQIHKDTKEFELVYGPTELTLSFLLDEGIKNMVTALFKDNLVQLNSAEHRILMQVTEVLILPEPEFYQSMTFKSLTPICISKSRDDEQGKEYLSIDDPLYSKYFAYNLVNKANAWLGEERYSADRVNWTCLSEKIKGKKYRVKGIDIKGKLYDFKITAPPELIRIGYYAGFGIANSSLGMGMVDTH